MIADLDTGVFVQADRIDRIDHDAIYSIAGPLTVPEPETGTSVIAWWTPNGGPTPVTADVSVGPGQQILPLDRNSRPLSRPGGPSGLLLNALPGEPLVRLLDQAEALFDAGLAPASAESLRAALQLPVPERALDRSPAFAAPTRGARL
ncbi:MAG: hypothetical protein QM658_12525 [Gordonia sp. (in: high G+C Gram-positive bacteria)]